MNGKKILKYALYFLVILFIAYLILIWMFFKDNVDHLTVSQIVIGLLLVPIIFIALFFGIKWKQKKLSEPKATSDDNDILIKDDELNHTIHDIFMYAGVILPEGENYKDIVNNLEDLTEISDNLLDFDGIPLLTKPIKNLEDLDLSSGIDVDDIEPATLKLCELIHSLVSQHQAVLMRFSANYDQLNSKDSQVNLAASMHPEWQQSYISSEDQNIDRSAYDDIQIISRINVIVFLNETMSYDQDIINNYVNSQMLQLGFPEDYIKVVIQSYDPINKPEYEVITHHVFSLDQDTAPILNIIFAPESEINEQWLDNSHTLYSNINQSNDKPVPEEAGVLIITWNKMTEQIVESETDTQYNLIKFIEEKNTDNGYNHHYKDFIKLSERFIEQNAAADSASDSTINSVSNNKEANKNKVDKQNSAKNSANNSASDISDNNYQILTDVNIIRQPHNASLVMALSDRLEQQGALIESANLGLYMQSNAWLNSLISLSLFIDATLEDVEDFDAVYLLTEYSDSNLLWSAKPKSN